jgi:hypothetical protein
VEMLRIGLTWRPAFFLHRHCYFLC